MENRLHYNNSFDDMDDDYIQNGKRKRLSQEDSETLLEAFNRNPKPNKDERNELASILGMNSRSIQIWFQNRRAKLRKESNDPDLFSTPSIKSIKAADEIVPLPQVTARNFKELCLPKYLDIPIKGQQMTNEDISKNDAIKNFWRMQQQEKTTAPLTDPSIISSSAKKYKPNSKLTPRASPCQNVESYKKTKLSTDFKDLYFDDILVKPKNMPEIVPFTTISNSGNSKKSYDYTSLPFLTQTVKEIQNSSTAKINCYKPSLDSVASNLDFLFGPSNFNSGNLDLLGSGIISSKHPSSSSHQQLDQVFSEIFSSFPES